VCYDGDVIGPVEALELARQLHGDQVDKLGENMVDGHLTRVQQAVKEYNDPELSVAAALHDSLEDTDVTAMLLLQSGVSPQALNIIVIVSRRPGEKYDDYIHRIIAGGVLQAVQLKIKDVQDHLRPIPDNIDPGDAGIRSVISLRSRYHRALPLLERAARQLEIVAQVRQ
jgi:hypothetical protein